MIDTIGQELTDSIVITKRFRSPAEFSLYIEDKVIKDKVGYMDAIINYCNEMDIEIDNIGPLVNQSLKDKLQLEAEDANLMKKRGKLPL